MIRYGAFIKVTETRSFTRAAQSMGYTQSAISQMIKSLEEELDTTLIIRSKKGIELSNDGEEFLPYIKNVYNAHRELIEKRNEMRGLGSGIIKIGTIASVSCSWLPQIMKEFKEKYPRANFELKQGEYTNIQEWIKDGSVDFGFINPDAAEGLTTVPLRKDEMLAVLPRGHKLAEHDSIDLEELLKEPYILLAEGSLSEPLEFFKGHNLEPNTQYIVYDDYTIMSMVEKGLGVSVISDIMLRKSSYDIVPKSISPKIERIISVAYKNKSVLPIVSRYFIDFIVSKRDELNNL